ncbi:MAG: hypothetical protein ACRDPW_02265, partial [Mycobacteriales bacterium]
FVPLQRSSTAQTRTLLPAAVPHADAAASAGRAALLVHALTTDPSLLLPATRDWLHQDARAAAMPDSAALIARLRAAGVPAALSGAGPAVLAFTDSTPAGDGVADLADHMSFQLHRLHIDSLGATATPVPAGRMPR